MRTEQSAKVKEKSSAAERFLVISMCFSFLFFKGLVDKVNRLTSLTRDTPP